MTWFDIKKLEYDLIEGNVSEIEIFNYLLASSLIFTIMPYFSDNNTANQILTGIEFVFEVILTVVLLKSTFGINSNGDNKDYLKRFISLSLISFIRLFVFALLPVFLFVVTIEILQSMKIMEDDGIKNIFEFIMSICLGIAYYFLLTNSFKRVSEKK